MKQIKIVLVEPTGPLNIGSIARVMKNMSLTNLVLVNPKCDPVGEEARQMAVHAQDILDDVVIVDSLPAALQGCQRAIATTARSRALPTELETPREALPWLIEVNTNSALIFGPEDRGLSNQELNYGQRFVGIPSNPAYPSLNLAQAVAVCAYELYQAFLTENCDKSPDRDSLESNEESLSLQNAPVEAIETYYDRLESLLLEIGYLYPHTAATRMAKIRRLYNRINLKSEELSMLRGMLRQIHWAINKKISSK
jgi:tRNA/rRNA methyltransferase